MVSIEEIVAKLEGPWGCDIARWFHDLGALQADVNVLIADWREKKEALDLASAKNPYKIDMPVADAKALWRHLYSDGRFALPEGWGGEINPPKVRI